MYLIFQFALSIRSQSFRLQLPAFQIAFCASSSVVNY